MEGVSRGLVNGQLYKQGEGDITEMENSYYEVLLQILQEFA